MSHFAVVQEKLEQIDCDVLRHVLIEHAGMVRADATKIARKQRGILSDRLSSEQATKVCAALRLHNYPTRVIATDKLPPREKAKPCKWFEIQSDGIAVPEGSAEVTQQIPWTSVFVISAGRVPEVRERQYETVEPFDSDGSVNTTIETVRSSRLMDVTELIAISDAGQYKHIRFNGQKFNYARTLGQDGVQQGWYQNYLAVLQRLVENCSFALVSPETRMLLVKRKQQHETRDSESTTDLRELRFAEYNRWLLLLAIFNAQKMASDSVAASGRTV